MISEYKDPGFTTDPTTDGKASQPEHINDLYLISHCKKRGTTATLLEKNCEDSSSTETGERRCHGHLV